MAQTRPKTRLHHAQDLRAGGQIAFSKDQAAYLTKVMRLKSGAEVGLFNGEDGEWRTRLIVEGPRHVVGQIEGQVCVAEPADGPTLAFAPIKRAPLEWMLIKATELGVSRLQPVITDHTQADLSRLDRVQALLIEASEQCERCRLPMLEPAKPLQRWLSEQGQVLVAAEAGEAQAVASLYQVEAIPRTLLIGPEGGFSASELESFASHPGLMSLNLGPLILKAETAALSLLTLYQAASKNWDARPAFRP